MFWQIAGVSVLSFFFGIVIGWLIAKFTKSDKEVSLVSYDPVAKKVKGLISGGTAPHPRFVIAYVYPSGATLDFSPPNDAPVDDTKAETDDRPFEVSLPSWPASSDVTVVVWTYEREKRTEIPNPPISSSSSSSSTSSTMSSSSSSVSSTGPSSSSSSESSSSPSSSSSSSTSSSSTSSSSSSSKSSSSRSSSSSSDTE